MHLEAIDGKQKQVGSKKSACQVVTRPGPLTEEQIQLIRHNPPLIMNAPEGAVYVDMSERNFREKARQGFFPYIKIGGRLLFRRDALDQALAKFEIKGI